MTSGPADDVPGPDGFPGWDDEEWRSEAVVLGAAERAALARLENGEPLTPADEAVLDRLGEQFCGPQDDGDSCACPPEEYAAWQADLAAADREAAAGVPGPVGREVLDAGFTHRGGWGGAGFAAGGVLDRLPAGWLLAVAADRAWDEGLGTLADAELAGLACAARRNAARAAGLELAVITELAARRAGPDGRPGEHLEDEVAALLTLTGRAAARRVALAAGVARLQAVAAALAAGRIDADKAAVFSGELMIVEDDLAAAAIAAAVAPAAPGMTAGELGAELR